MNPSLTWLIIQFQDLYLTVVANQLFSQAVSTLLFNNGGTQAKHVTGINLIVLSRKWSMGSKDAAVVQPLKNQVMLTFFLMGREDGKCWGWRWILVYFQIAVDYLLCVFACSRKADFWKQTSLHNTYCVLYLAGSLLNQTLTL